MTALLIDDVVVTFHRQSIEKLHYVAIYLYVPANYDEQLRKAGAILSSYNLDNVLSLYKMLLLLVFQQSTLGDTKNPPAIRIAVFRD
jgi:hypothetical protein